MTYEIDKHAATRHLFGGCAHLQSCLLGGGKKQLEAALAAVEANLKTSAGKQYDELAGKGLTEKYLASLKPCKQSLPSGTRIDPFDMFLKLDSDGKVREGLVYPETRLAAKFSSPPHGDYWINIHMEFKH